MSAPATGYYQPGTSWIHQRHPVTKLLAMLLTILAAFMLAPILLPVLVAVLALIALSAGLAAPLIRAMRIPAVLFGSILLVNALFYPGATDRMFDIGPLAISREGLVFGLTTAGRVLVAFLASVLFLFTTIADDLMEALVARGANYRLAFVVLSAVQMVPRLQARATGILEAQQARGLATSGSVARRVRALVPLIGPVLLSSLIEVRERTFALEARGFGATASRTAYRHVADTAVDRVARPILLLAMVGVAVLGILGVPGR